MRRPEIAALLAAAVLVGAAPAAGQTSALRSGPPGPYVVDVRGAALGIPQNPLFYPEAPPGTIVPTRGFGFDIGGHVYPWRLGGARIGLGANWIQVRGTARPGELAEADGVVGSPEDAGSTDPGSIAPGGGIPDVTSRVRVVAPQVSLNFGTARGWSYLSGGLGVGRVQIESVGATEARRDSGSLRVANIGGGARWFVSRHVAVSFDLRLYRLAGSMLFAAGAGVSFK